MAPRRISGVASGFPLPKFSGAQAPSQQPSEATTDGRPPLPKGLFYKKPAASAPVDVVPAPSPTGGLVSTPPPVQSPAPVQSIVVRQAVTAPEAPILKAPALEASKSAPSLLRRNNGRPSLPSGLYYKSDAETPEDFAADAGGVKAVASGIPESETPQIIRMLGGEPESSGASSLIQSLGDPHAFVNLYFQNKDKIGAGDLARLFHFMDQTPEPEAAYEALPELLTLIRPYQQAVDDVLDTVTSAAGQNEKARETQTAQALSLASKGVTRLYGYTDSSQPPVISEVLPLVLDNWGRMAELGLSFVKWKYDAMTRWKGMGKKVEKLPLLVESGLFQKMSVSDVDKTFGNSFYHHDAQSGLFVEMRRAYLLISKPDAGTVVIRNSSKIFGRDLLPAYGYYSADKTFLDKIFPGSGSPFNPKNDLAEQNSQQAFSYVFDKDLHTSLEKQREVHVKIKALLDGFDDLMDRYFLWKSDKKEDVFAPGFNALLEAVVQSSQRKGAFTPFGKHKFLRLTWINRYGYPYPVRSFSSRMHAAELEAFSNILNQYRSASVEEIKSQMPKLHEFLSFGLERGLELIITDESEHQPGETN